MARHVAIRVLCKWCRREMATPGQLVKAMAATLGLSEATVGQYDRVLAENGLRSKGGRGLSAARVTAADAANLLIAIMASPISVPLLYSNELRPRRPSMRGQRPKSIVDLRKRSRCHQRQPGLSRTACS